MLDAPDDSADVPSICHQILVQLCARQPLSVLAAVDSLCVEFVKTFDKRPVPGKEEKVRLCSRRSGRACRGARFNARALLQDPEKADRRMTIVRSAMRAVDALCALPNASEERALAELVANVARVDLLRHIAESENLAALLRFGGAQPVAGGAKA
jgi:hypothetical protein